MGGEVALALGDGVRAETDGATSAVELAGALAAVEEVETAGPGAGSPLQPKHVSAARMQAERNVAAKVPVHRGMGRSVGVRVPARWA
jgi:hypothetical protein